VVKNFKGYNFSYYTVKPKETIYGIRKNFNIPEDLFYEMNPDLLTEALKAGQKIRIPHQTTLSEKPEPSLRQQARFADTVNTLRYYKVRFLEKAEGIARREQVSLEKIYELNPDVRQNGVSWGDVIKLPRKAKIKKEIISVEAREKPVRDSTIRYFTHVVKKKQTLYSISKLYGVDQADIIALNPGSEFGIKRGSALRIPVGLDKEKEPVVAEEKEITDISEDADTRVCYAKVGFQNRVRVALMLPLYLDELPRDTSLRTSKNVRSYNFIQFYEGAMLALDTLRQQGVEADVYVYDVGKTAVSARKQFDSRLRSMDLIIGPVYHEAFHEVAQFASEHDIPVVNPFSTRQKITDYRTAFKVATPVKRELDAMARYINRHFDGETNIYVVRSNPYRQLENLAYLKHQLEKYRTPTIMPRHIFDVTYSTDSLNPMLDTLNKSERNVVIGLSEQDIFTINFIRHLNEMRDSIQGVTLFGLSEWKKMDLGTSYLLNLDVHYFDDEFIDYQKPEVKWFIRKFRNRYFTEPMPSKYAFKGFDITHYFVGALARYGKDYRHCIPHYHPFYLETRMDFRPTSKGGFENSFTGLIQFHGYRRVMTKTGRD
jgi:LysM repeat protein/ABC-type branched-subunit amino acid transport system substrate-binding protein